MRYCPVCVIVRSLLLPVFCYRRVFVIGGTLLSPGLCYRQDFVIARDFVITGALLSPGLCYHRGFVIDESLLSPGLLKHFTFWYTLHLYVYINSRNCTVSRCKVNKKNRLFCRFFTSNDMCFLSYTKMYIVFYRSINPFRPYCIVLFSTPIQR